MTDTPPRFLREVVSHTIGGGWGSESQKPATIPVYIIRGADFPDIDVRRVGKLPLRYEPSSKVESRRLLAGDIVLETSGGTADRPTGRTVFISKELLSGLSGDVIPASFCRLIRVDPKEVDSRFLYYLFQDLYRTGGTWEYQNQSTGISNFQYELFSRKLRIPAISLDEQRAIAEVLGALDDKIAANTRIADALCHLAMTVFEAAIATGGITVALGDIAGLVTRGIAPSYSDAEDSVVVLNQKCVRNQRVVLAPSRRTDSSRARGDKLLRPDDVLVNSTGQGTLGRVARWNHDGIATVDSHISIVRFDPSSVDTICAGYATLRAQPLIESLGEGSTGQTELSRISLTAVTLQLPAPESQSRRGAELGALDTLARSYAEENIRLAATRDALLPALMSGRLRVRDVAKSVEEVL